MANSENWELVDLDSPDRCQASFGNGQQCCVKKLPGTEYCIKHQNHTHNQRMYQLQKYQRKFERFISNPNLRSLHEEVGLLRMTLESIIEQTGGNQKALILFSSKIVELVRGVRETLNSCHRLELATGKLLDKSQVVTLAERMVTIISSYIADPVILERISEEIAVAIAETSNEWVSTD